MEEEESVWEYLERKRLEESTTLMNALYEIQKEEDREMLRHIKAVEAKKEEKLRKRREKYAAAKGRPKN